MVLRKPRPIFHVANHFVRDTVCLIAMSIHRVSPLHVWVFETISCIICVIINMNTSHGAKDPMGRGQRQKKRHTPGRWQEPLLLKCCCNFKNLKYNAIHLASHNKKQHFRQCELPLISNLANTCLLSCQNLSKYRPKPTTHRYHLIPGNLALLSGGKSRVQPEIMSRRGSFLT